MLEKTNAIVLRSLKYGETSLILQLFTERFGAKSYIIKGVRNARSKSKRAGLLQVASLLEIVAEHKPGNTLSYLQTFEQPYIYQHLQEEIPKNAVAIFSVELLSKLLPEAETMEDLFDFVWVYFQNLDKEKTSAIATYPLYFAIQCGKYLGYNVYQNFGVDTPYLSAAEGKFISTAPSSAEVNLSDEEVALMLAFISKERVEELQEIKMNTITRNHLLDWYIQFLAMHTQHLGKLKSLAILRSILH